MTTLDENTTGQLRSNMDLIGREEINDLEAVLNFVGEYDAEGFHRVPDNCPAEFTWDYEKGAKPQLDKLYEKAKKAQWNGQTDLDWSIEVDQERVVIANAEANPSQMQFDEAAIAGTVLEKWDEKRFLQFGVENQNWLLSQFMHGEQGALLCTAKIVETVPWIDAKYYAATQVMDEARHVEVFSKYLDEKLSGHYPMNAHLGLLLDDIVADSRWDMTYLGMQIMVEGLALAAFGFIHMMTTEPLLKKLLRYVMADEARHVAFGVLSLQEYYQELERVRAARTPGVRVRGGHPHEGPPGHAGGVGAHGGAHARRDQADAGGTGARRLPDPALLQDRAEPQEAGSARCRRRLAPHQVHRNGCHRLRGPHRLHPGRGCVRRRIAGRAPGRLSGSIPGAAAPQRRNTSAPDSAGSVNGQ